MTMHIAFLRAVNLGARKVPMSRLVEVAERLGYRDVWTYVNSGNVVFDAPGSPPALAAALGRECELEFGFECTTFVRTADDLKKALAWQPFSPRPGDTYFITFLQQVPTATAATALQALSNDFDTLLVHGADVHWLMRGKSTESALSSRDWAKILGDRSSTSRNTTMLTKLAGRIASRAAG